MKSDAKLDDIKKSYPNIKVPLQKNKLSETSDFRAFVTDYKECYVDKTLWISKIINDRGTNVKLISRPHGFGKTINLTMLDYFFSQTKKQEVQESKLFSPFMISKHPQSMREQGRYPVIYLDFHKLKAESLEE